MGLLWRPGVRSVVSGGAEYQRFFSRAPARAGSLWQIWATRRRGPGGEVGRGVRPDDRGDRFDDPVGPAGAPVREGSQRPTRSQGGLAHPRVPPGGHRFFASASRSVAAIPAGSRTGYSPRRERSSQTPPDLSRTPDRTAMGLGRRWTTTTITRRHEEAPAEPGEPAARVHSSCSAAVPTVPMLHP